MEQFKRAQVVMLPTESLITNKNKIGWNLNKYFQRYQKTKN